MIRRWVFSLCIVIVLLIIQSTWLDFIAIHEVIPDLSLIAVLYIAFKNPGLQGQTIGFAVGFLQDGISAAPLGLNSFIKTSVAWVANLLSGKFYIDKILMPIIFGFVATLLKAIYLAVLSVFFADKILHYDFLASTLWIEAGYNALVAPVLFFIFKPLDRFIIPQEQR